MAAAEDLISTPASYVGRFAPSPTGPLHAGSLVAAMASYADARAHGGRWLLRIEDVDTPRCSKESEREIIRQLHAFGFEHDGDVLHQSKCTERYDEALAQLWRHGQTFVCACTRKLLAQEPRNTEGETIYPGTCRHRSHAQGSGAIRLRVNSHNAQANFVDRAFGAVEQDLAHEVGDFVLKRADGLYAYQLAVVVDDAFQGVTHVVRGEDLLMNTPRQIYLQDRLSIPHPHYLHVPLVRNAAGEKLSKQTLAAPLDERDRVATLHHAWAFLRQLEVSNSDSVAAFWSHALPLWDATRLAQR